MSSPSTSSPGPQPCLLAGIYTYDSPEDAIDGILEETKALAQHFSAPTKMRLLASVYGIADQSKAKINKIAQDFIKQLSEVEESEWPEPQVDTWEIAHSMHTLSLRLLQEAERQEPQKQKLITLRQQIQTASLSPISQNVIEAVTIGTGGFLGSVSTHYVATAAATFTETRAINAVSKAMGKERMCEQELRAARQANRGKVVSMADANKVKVLKSRLNDLSLKSDKAKEILAERIQAKQALRPVRPAQVLTKAAVVGAGTVVGWAALKTAGGAVNLLLGSSEAH